MKTCPNCKREIPDEDWICPYCKSRVPVQGTYTGHASSPNFEENQSHFIVSGEDKAMIRDKNHQTSSPSDEEEGYLPDQPYTDGISRYDH